MKKKYILNRKKDLSNNNLDLINKEKKRRLTMEKNLGRVLSDSEYNFIRNKMMGGK